MAIPFISICIPAYKNRNFLKRLLDSIASQEFQDFEVIVSDDSPDNDVQSLLRDYDQQISITYHRNEPALGSPANWNAAIQMARAEWIKIMHDDDWFRSSDALGAFAEAARAGEGDFLFSAYYNCPVEQPGQERLVTAPPNRLRLLRQNAATLLAGNVIGPPSATLFKKQANLNFNTQMKWLVDIEFYLRYIQHGHRATYLKLPLVNIGISQLQITRQAQLNPLVEIPEHFLFLAVAGLPSLRNLLVYDAWWRLFRNLGIRKAEALAQFGYTGKVPAIFSSMIKWQKAWPESWLRFGPLSKILMFFHFVTHQKLSGISDKEHAG